MSKNELNFSVIIPLYNKERHVERCLESVFRQTYHEYEIIVVDDGSTDNSVEIVKRFLNKKQIKILHQENSGVSSARNSGIREAKHSHIAFLDSDDAWKPDFLETIIKLAEIFPDAGAYATAYDIIRKDGRRYFPEYKYVPYNENGVLIPNYFKSMIYGMPMITSSSVCIKKNTFESIGTFPVEERLGEDKDMWARIAIAFPIAFSWKICATYFENADNRTCLKYIPNYERYFIKTLQKMLDKKEIPHHFENDVKKYISKNLIKLASNNIKFGNSEFALKILNDKRCNIYLIKKSFWYITAKIPYSILSTLIKRFKYIREKIVKLTT